MDTDLVSNEGSVNLFGELSRHWRLLLVGAIAGAVIGILYAEARGRDYAAEATVVVGPRDGFLGPESGTAAESYTQTMRELLASDAVAREAARSRGVDADTLSSNLDVTSRPESSALVVRLVDSNGARAVSLLSATIDAFRTLVANRLRASNAPSPARVEVFDEPHPAGRTGLSPLAAAVFGAILGLGVAAAAALLGLRRSRRLHGVADAESSLNAPVLGALPRLVPFGNSNGKRRARSLNGNLDLLRANVERFSGGHGVVSVTGPKESASQRDVVANLATALASAGHQVVCVSCDTESAALEGAFGLARVETGERSVGEGSPLLTSLREVPVSLDDSLDGSRTTRSTLPGAAAGRVFVASIDCGNPRAEELQSVLADLGERADFVLLDAPPLLEGARAFPFVDASSVVLAVLEDGKLRIADAHAMRARLDQLRSGRVGVVLVGQDENVALAAQAAPAERESGIPAAATR